MIDGGVGSGGEQARTIEGDPGAFFPKHKHLRNARSDPESPQAPRSTFICCAITTATATTTPTITAKAMHRTPSWVWSLDKNEATQSVVGSGSGSSTRVMPTVESGCEFRPRSRRQLSCALASSSWQVLETKYQSRLDCSRRSKSLRQASQQAPNDPPLSVQSAHWDVVILIATDRGGAGRLMHLVTVFGNGPAAQGIKMSPLRSPVHESTQSLPVPWAYSTSPRRRCSFHACS